MSYPHFFPRSFTGESLREYFFPQFKTLDPKIRTSLHAQATPALFLMIGLTVVVSLIILAITIFTDASKALFLAKSLFLYMPFFLIILALHNLFSGERRDFYLLLVTLLFIATWGITKDVINFELEANRYGVIYVTFVFFGLIFMPFPPYVALFSGAYCAILFGALWSPFIEHTYGYQWLLPLQDLLGITWISDHLQVIERVPLDTETYFTGFWYFFQYLLYGSVAFIFRAANIHSIIKTFITHEDLLETRSRLILARDQMSKGENQHVEYKSSARWDFKQKRINKDLEMVIIKTIAGFMNSEGGVLFIGVDDDGTVVGVKHDYKTVRNQNLDGYELHLSRLIFNHLGKDLHRNIEISFFKEEGEDVCAVHVRAGERPLFIEAEDQAFFVRTGNSTQRLGTREALAYIKRHFG